jgi:hypothetical protein
LQPALFFAAIVPQNKTNWLDWLKKKMVEKLNTIPPFLPVTTT